MSNETKLFAFSVYGNVTILCHSGNVVGAGDVSYFVWHEMLMMMHTNLFFSYFFVPWQQNQFDSVREYTKHM